MSDETDALCVSLGGSGGAGAGRSGREEEDGGLGATQRGQRGQGASQRDGAGSWGPRAGLCVCNPGGRRSSQGGGSGCHPFLVTGGGRRGLHVELEAEAKPDRVKS